MTVASQTNKVTGLGNGVAVTFSFSPMVIYASSDMTVTHVSATGVETLLTEGTGSANYSVTVAKYPGTGSVVYPADEVTPLPSGEKLVMKPVFTLEQQTDLDNQGGYNPDTLEQQLDKLVRIDLQQQETIDRAIAAPKSVTLTSTELPVPVGGQGLMWNAGGDALINGGLVSSGVAATAFMQTVLDDVTADAALTTLGGSTLGKSLFGIASAAAARTALELQNGALLKHNHAASAPPGVNDDSGDGYSVGSRWTDLTSGLVYSCLSNTAGAASWTLVTNSTPDGQCQFRYVSSTQATLFPFGGSNLKLHDGTVWQDYAIPDAGLTIDTTATQWHNGVTFTTAAASTLYYIVAQYNGGVPVLYALPFASYTRTDSLGKNVINGLPDMRVVGMVRTGGGPNIIDTAASRFVISYFNRRLRNMKAPRSNGATSSTTPVEISSAYRGYLLSWGEDAVQIGSSGYMSNSATANWTAINFFESLNGAAGVQVDLVTPLHHSSTANHAGASACHAVQEPGEGEVWYNMGVKASGGVASLADCQLSAMFRG